MEAPKKAAAVKPTVQKVEKPKASVKPAVAKTTPKVVASKAAEKFAALTIDILHKKAAPEAADKFAALTIALLHKKAAPQPAAAKKIVKPKAEVKPAVAKAQKAK